MPRTKEDKKKYDREYYHLNKDKKNEHRKNHYLNNRERQKKISLENHYKLRQNPELYLWTRAKNRAGRKNLDFNIEPDDIIIPEVCPILGIPLFRSNGRPTANSPTVDRKDNSKGYVKGNIAVISYKANSTKGDLSIKQIQNLHDYMISSVY